MIWTAFLQVLTLILVIRLFIDQMALSNKIDDEIERSKEARELLAAPIGKKTYPTETETPPVYYMENMI